jgi:hypothetical protein
MKIFPYLYRIVRRKSVAVSQVLSTTPLNVSFRWALTCDKLEDRHNSVDSIVPMSLNEKFA